MEQGLFGTPTRSCGQGHGLAIRTDSNNPESSSRRFEKGQALC